MVDATRFQNVLAVHQLDRKLVVRHLIVKLAVHQLEAGSALA